MVMVVEFNDRGSRDGVAVVEAAPRGWRQKLKQWYQGTRSSYGKPSGTAFCKRSSHSDGQSHFKGRRNE